MKKVINFVSQIYIFCKNNRTSYLKKLGATFDTKMYVKNRKKHVFLVKTKTVQKVQKLDFSPFLQI